MNHTLSSLFGKFRLAAHKKKGASEIFELRCKSLAELTTQSLVLWQQAESGTASQQQERNGETIAQFWMGVLHTALMREGEEYLTRCTWHELQDHVQMVYAIFSAAARCDSSPRLLLQVTALRTSIAALAEEVRNPTKKPLLALPPPEQKGAEVINLKMFRATRK